MRIRSLQSIALLAALAACGSYDAALLRPAGKRGAAKGGAAAVDGAVRLNDGGDGSSQLGSSLSGMGGENGGAAGSSGQVGTCISNPDPTRADCLMICPEQCNGEDDDCDGAIDEDVDNACALEHATGACARGRCAIVQCQTGYRDCDHDAADGCEVAPGDVNNCGVCGMRCSFAHAIAACVDDKCAPSGCDPLYADCDQSSSDCETMVNTLQSCSACGRPCVDGDVPNAIASCQSGTCGVGVCLGAYGDCNGAGSDGCEQSLATNAHCGGCGLACDLVGSVDDCSSGTCLAQMCEPGYADCNGNPGDGCEALDQPAHCGACDKTCDGSLANVTSAGCNGGQCAIACATGFGDCDADVSTGCETQLTSAQRCGSCTGVCAIANADSSCGSGSCALVSCKPGFGDCDADASTGCETPLDQNDHCGACATSCVGTATPACSGGTCSTLSCAPGTADCNRDGNTCEVNLKTDSSNCGACGNACAYSAASPHASGLSCVSGQCVPACNALFANCNGDYTDGCETPLDSLLSCGGCGVGCAIANAIASCSGGSCHVGQCAPDYADCNTDGKSCETQLGTTASCTGCGMGCSLPNAVPSCAGSAGSHSCAISSCSQAYYADCDGLPGDGCEVDTRGDSVHCGGCGTNCNNLAHVVSASCANSACSFGCATGYGNCNSMPGCETSFATTTNCGACGRACDATTGTPSCSSSTKCTYACNAGRADCNAATAPDTDGCETDATTTSNCGGCGTVCSSAPVNGQPACVSGSCSFACNTGYTACGGACVDTTSDDNNCGTCNHVCSGGTPNCSSSVCVAPCTMVTLPPAVDVDPSPWAVDFETAPVWSCNAAGTTTITSSGTGSISGDTCGGTATLDFTNGVTQSVGSGPTVMVVRLRGLTVTNNHVIQLRGDKPIVFLVSGNVLVDLGGKIDAGAAGTTAGPGGSLSSACGTSASSTGTGHDGKLGGGNGSGGGGGGFGSAGGKAGDETSDNLTGGAGGPVSTSTNLQPLRGGCAGGQGYNGGSNNAGGAGGGAFEISASGTITIGTGTNAATLSAAGGGSPRGTDAFAASGGGGSGGGILLVSPAPASFGTNGTARVHGGGSASGGGGNNGQDGHSADNTAASGGSGSPTGAAGGLCAGANCVSASATGAAGVNSSQDSSGGGGGGGRVQVATGTAMVVCK